MIVPRAAPRRLGPAGGVALGLVLLPVLVFFSPLPAAIAQLVVDRATLTVHACEVSEPTADSAHVSCSTSCSVPWLPVRVTADEATASVSRGGGGDNGGGGVLGHLMTPPLDFGLGGRIDMTISGVLRVSDQGAMRAFASEMYSAEFIALQLDAPMRLHVGGMLTLDVRFRQAPVLRGARSFPTRVLSIEIADADGAAEETARLRSSASPLSAYPGLRPPNTVSILAEVSNPSTFAMLPLGAISVRVQTPDGAVIAHMASNPSTPLSLLHGTSLVRLSGVFAVNRADMPSASALLSEHLSGRPTSLEAVVTRISTPLWNATFGGMTLASTLPGETSALLDTVRVVIDSGRIAEWANPLGPHVLMLDAYLSIVNPLDASFAVMRIDADILYEGERVGSMRVVLDASDPAYDLDGLAYAPILVRPREAYTTPRPYPCVVSGSLPTINSMLATLHRRGSISVTARSNLSVGTGAIFPTIAYDQSNVTVRQWHAPPSPPAPPSLPFSLDSIKYMKSLPWYRPPTAGHLNWR